MKSLFRPFLVLVAALPLVLAACGNKEPEQRAAFTQFLQTRIVDKPGVRVPTLTDEEKKSFGDYAAHYAVITDFNSGMDASVKPLSGIMQKGAVRSLNDIVARRDDLKAVYDKAYDKTVSLPADTFRDVLPQLNATFDSSLKIADYVDAHKAQIEISGPIVKVQDPAVQAELNQLLQDLNAQAKNLQQANTRMQAVMLGR